jgi:voltage-gated potassium channel
MLAPFKENKSLTLLVSLGLLMLVYPFFEMSRLGSVLYTMLFVTALLASVYAISYDVRYIAVGLLLVTPILICHLSNFILGSPAIEIIMRICTLIFMVYTVIALLQRVLTVRKTGINEIYGAIGAYVLIGIIFGFLYLLVEIAVPGSFQLNGSPADVASFVYFSFVALSTAGFGDITAAAPFARAIVVIELITGVTYVAVLIGRLISASQAKSENNEDADEVERLAKERVVGGLLQESLPLKQRPIGVIAACVMINFVMAALMHHFQLPFFLDSWGTMLAVILGGWWFGAVTAVFYNALAAAALWGWPAWVWVFSSLWIAALTRFLSEKKRISVYKPLHLILAGVLTGVLNGILVQAITYFGNMEPYEGTLPVFHFFLKATSSAAFAALAEKMFVEIADQTLSLMLAAAAVFLIHDLLGLYKKRLEKNHA